MLTPGTGDFLCGVIEGFYGRPWSHATRLAYAEFLPALGLNTSIYCPKADPFLRKRWREQWPAAQWRQLRELSARYRQCGLYWGPGLSPFALYQDYGAVQQRQLRAKVAQLLELEPGLLAILFDDMPGDLPDLAARQAGIIADVRGWAPGLPLLVCPTYYSFDPVLEKYFGNRPDGYWPQLARELPADTAIFWTGNQVCSESVTREDVRRISRQLAHPLVLWDNYPVNDGAARSRHLYCQPLAGRDPDLRQALAGHLCNPMNQALVSLPALSGLATLYGRAPANDDWLVTALGAATWQQLQENAGEFRELGLDGMGAQRCRELAQSYQALPGAAAAEVAGWLRGEYTFDPACLTD